MNKKLITSLVILCFSNQFALAETNKETQKPVSEETEITSDSEIIQEMVSDIFKEDSLSSSERIKIILDEKKRLRTVSKRRSDDYQIDLGKNYIRNTLYSNHVKGLMREGLFYMNYLIENSDNKEKLKIESKNIAWNSICLSNILKEESEIVFPMLQTAAFSIETIEEKKYNDANMLLMEIFNEDSYRPSTQEINIRCHEVYKNKNVNAKD